MIFFHLLVTLRIIIVILMIKIYILAFYMHKNSYVKVVFRDFYFVYKI